MFAFEKNLEFSVYNLRASKALAPGLTKKSGKRTAIHLCSDGHGQLFCPYIYRAHQHDVAAGLARVRIGLCACTYPGRGNIWTGVS